MWRGRPRPRTQSSSGPRPVTLSIKSTTNQLLLPLILCTLLLSASTIAVAQRGGSGIHSAPAIFHASNGNHAFIGHAYSGFRHSFPYGYPYGLGYPGYSSLPFPFFGDDFDPNDVYSTGYPVASAPPPYLMQALQGLVNPAGNSMASIMTPPSNHEGSSNEPLMIELQNGRYVRVNGPVINGDAEPITFPENSTLAKPASKAAKATPQPAQPETIAAAPLPPVTLIFRDGHSEEVRDYTIAQGTLYARGDYYTDGYWNKRIDLANLDVPATLQANASRNVSFVLPSSPNEVITRP
jgi:hypothetical protein